MKLSGRGESNPLQQQQIISTLHWTHLNILHNSTTHSSFMFPYLWHLQLHDSMTIKIDGKKVGVQMDNIVYLQNK